MPAGRQGDVAAPIPLWLPPLILAPFVGSFLGVLIRSLPEGRPVALRRSACEACGQALGPIELLPIVSFVVLRGRCRHCGAPIARMHLAVELAALGVAAWAASVLADAPTLWAGCVLGWTLLALGWIDWTHMVLPDALTLPLVLAGLGVTWRLEPEALTDHAAAAIAGYVAFRLLELGYRRLRGRDGLGQGDAKLAAACGAWVGTRGAALGRGGRRRRRPRRGARAAIARTAGGRGDRAALRPGAGAGALGGVALRRAVTEGTTP